MSDLLTEDLYVDAECIKKGDYLYPWDDCLNANRQTYYKVLDTHIKDVTVIMRLQYMGESLLTFKYVTKIGTKERIFVLT